MNPYTPEPGHLIPVLRQVDRLGWFTPPIRATWRPEIVARNRAIRNGLIEQHPTQTRYRLTDEGKAILARWRRRQPGVPSALDVFIKFMLETGPKFQTDKELRGYERRGGAR